MGKTHIFIEFFLNFDFLREWSFRLGIPIDFGDGYIKIGKHVTRIRKSVSTMRSGVDCPGGPVVQRVLLIITSGTYVPKSQQPPSNFHVRGLRPGPSPTLRVTATCNFTLCMDIDYASYLRVPAAPRSTKTSHLHRGPTRQARFGFSPDVGLRCTFSM